MPPYHVVDENLLDLTTCTTPLSLIFASHQHVPRLRRGAPSLSKCRGRHGRAKEGTDGTFANERRASQREERPPPFRGRAKFPGANRVSNVLHGRFVTQGCASFKIWPCCNKEGSKKRLEGTIILLWYLTH